MARQDQKKWAAFFTHLLPEDTESRRVAIEEAEAELERATTAQGGATDAGLSGPG